MKKELEVAFKFKSVRNQYYATFAGIWTFLCYFFFYSLEHKYFFYLVYDIFFYLFQHFE